MVMLIMKILLFFGWTRKSTSTELAIGYPVDTDTWFHLAVVKDNYDITFYINGIDVTGGPNTGYSPPFDNYIESNQSSNIFFGIDPGYTQPMIMVNQ